MQEPKASDTTSMANLTLLSMQSFTKTGGANEEETDILDISSKILFRIPPVVVRIVSWVDLFEYQNMDSLRKNI